MSIKERYIKRKTPPFFKTIAKIGATITGLSLSLVALPVALPPIIMTIATHLMVAGTIATTVAAAVTNEDIHHEEAEEDNQNI